MRSPMPANSTVWSPTISPPRMVAKPMEDGSRSPVTPFAGKHATFLEVAPQRVRDHFAHLQCRAAGRIDLVAVVGFDDFDVVAGGHRLGRHLQQLERDIHAHAHVGRHHDGDALGGFGDLGFLLVGKPRRANHQVHPLGHTSVHMGHRALGAGEVDQATGVGQATGDIRGDGHPRGVARIGAGILSDGSGWHRCPAHRPARSRRWRAGRRSACDPCARWRRPHTPGVEALEQQRSFRGSGRLQRRETGRRVTRSLWQRRRRQAWHSWRRRLSTALPSR